VRAVDLRNLPAKFPILVVTHDGAKRSYEAEIVYKESLDAFLASHPSYTFLVPEGLDESLQKEIYSRCRCSPGYRGDRYDWQAGHWFAHFKVERRSKDRQSLRVECTWDDDRKNVGWYEATDKEVIPKSYLFYFGPGVAIYEGTRALFIAALIWLITLFIIQAIWKRLFSTPSPDR
jgi:hypothetical protein